MQLGPQPRAANVDTWVRAGTRRYQGLNRNQNQTPFVHAEWPRLPLANADAWKAAYDRHSNLESLLGLNSSVLDSFKTYFVVLAPFLSGVLGVTLPFTS